MKALSHPARILMVDILRQGERSAGELNRVAKINQSNISRHLSVLKKAGILTDRREGMKVIYRLHTPCILPVFDCAAEVVRADARKRSEYLRHV